MPFADFKQTMQCLDYKRLGKQRQESLQILKALLNLVPHYKSQPQAKAWKGYEKALCLYGIESCIEWKQRGYVDNTKVIFDIIDYQYLRDKPIVMPKWIGNERYHANQKGRLLFKNPHWYGQFGWKEEPEEFYWFPEY